MQGNGWFTEHIKRKLLEANKCLYVLRRLRKEEYNQVEIDHLFQSLVLPKISYVLLVYAASIPELNTVQQFLRRCHKRRFISYAINIYDLLEKTDRSILTSRRLVAYLLICCVICCPENLQNVWEFERDYYPVLTKNVLKLVSLIDGILNQILLLFH